MTAPKPVAAVDRPDLETIAGARPNSDSCQCELCNEDRKLADTAQYALSLESRAALLGTQLAAAEARAAEAEGKLATLRKIDRVGDHGDICVWSDGHEHMFSPTSLLRAAESRAEAAERRVDALESIANELQAKVDRLQLAALAKKPATGEG